MAQVPQVPGDVNQDELINQVNNAVRELNNRDTVQVYKDDAGTRRVILDKDGLRTSPEGVDVYTATNDQLTFNSNNNVFKIIATGTVELPGPATSGSNPSTVSVTHGLGYTPIVFAHGSDGGDYQALPWITTWKTGTPNAGMVEWEISYTANPTTINFYWQSNLGLNGGSITIKYYILQETAN